MNLIDKFVNDNKFRAYIARSAVAAFILYLIFSRFSLFGDSLWGNIADLAAILLFFFGVNFLINRFVEGRNEWI